MKRMEFGDASGTALLDVETREWSTKVVDFVAEDLPGKLHPLKSSKKAHGVLRTELRRKWGLSKSPEVSAGRRRQHDGRHRHREHPVRSGHRKPRHIGHTFGFSTAPVVDPKGEIAAFCDSTDNWMPLVCTMNLTLVTEHLRKLFAWDYAALEATIRSVPAGSDGLLMLPYLTGERTPDLPNGSGVLHGLTLQNFNPAHLARAAMEGVTLGLGYGLARFRELGLQPSEIRLTGGGSNSPIWRQICADVFGVPAICLQSGEGAGLGAAIQAGWTWNKENGSDAQLNEIAERLVKVDESSRTQPDAGATEIYAGALDRSARIRRSLHDAGLQ